MAPRAVWKGYLRLVLIACPVALYKATGEADKISFAQISRRTGNKVNQLKVDALTGEIVESADVAKGIEIAAGQYVEVADEEIAACAPPSAAVIDIDRFVRPGDIDGAYAEEHFFMVPDGTLAVEAFALLRDAIAGSGVVAIAPFAKGSAERLAAIAPCGRGLVLTRLRLAGEVRSSGDAFARIPALVAPEELVEIARGIVANRHGAFEPAHLDRYQRNLAELIRSKITGQMLKPAAPPEVPQIADLGEAVRKSARQPAKRKAG